MEYIVFVIIVAWLMWDLIISGAPTLFRMIGGKKNAAKFERAKQLYDLAYDESRMELREHDLKQGEKRLLEQLPWYYRESFEDYCRDAKRRYELTQNGDSWTL